MKSSSSYPKHFGLAVRRCQLAMDEIGEASSLDQVHDGALSWATWMLADLPPKGTTAAHDPCFQQICENDTCDV